MCSAPSSGSRRSPPMPAYVEKPRPLPYLAALAAMALALLAKPMAVTLPCTLLLIDAWPLNRLGSIPWRRLALEKVPFFLLSLGSCWMTMHAPRKDTVVTTETLSIASRLSNALVSYVLYLRSIFLPVKLGVFYPHPIQPQPLFLAGCSAVAARGDHGRRALVLEEAALPARGLAVVSRRARPRDRSDADRFAGPRRSFLLRAGDRRFLRGGLVGERVLGEKCLRTADRRRRRAPGLCAPHGPPGHLLAGWRHPFRAHHRGHEEQCLRLCQCRAASRARRSTGESHRAFPGVAPHPAPINP